MIANVIGQNLGPGYSVTYKQNDEVMQYVKDNLSEIGRQGGVVDILKMYNKDGGLTSYGNK
jgi:hypothetical protein